MKKFLLYIFVFISFISLVSSESWAKVYVTEPLLVPESPYAGMTFYVYKPYNMPKGWYITLDGYPVKKNKDGMWVYGTCEGPNLVATSYVVGSVVPSMAGITKYISDVQISELRKLPNQEMQAVRQGGFTRSELARGKNTSTYIPDWTFKHEFMTIGNWKGSVDRIGVLDKPAVPVAWQGKHPKVIYLWTGNSWYQIDLLDSQTPARAIRQKYLEIQRLVRLNNFRWYEQDMPILAQQAKAWGYYWLGEISVTR